MFLGSTIEFLVPNFIGKIINEFKEENFEGEGGVKELIYIWLVMTLFSSLCTAVRELLFGITSQRIGFSLRQSLYEAMIAKDINFYDNSRIGNLLSRLGSDTQVVQEGLTTNISMLMKSGTIVIGTIAILFTYNVWVTLVIIAVVIPQIFVTRIAMRYRNAFGATYQKAKTRMSNIATESLQNVRTVKCFADEEMTLVKFIIKTQELFEYGRARTYFWGAYQVSTKFLGGIGDIFLIFFLTTYMDYYELSIGEVTAIMLYVRVIMNNNNALFINMGQISDVFGAAYEIAVLIVSPNLGTFDGTKKPEPSDDSEQAQFKVDNVKFAYPSKKNVPVLKGVTIDIQKNSIIAIVGHSGCGKSSIIALMERFYDPTAGEMLFLGEDLMELDNKWYHQKQVALVQQEPILFSSTIKKNILYGIDFGDATEEEKMLRLTEACRQAGALNFIQDKALFPEGFDSKVGERGVRISGGQK